MKKGFVLASFAFLLLTLFIAGVVSAGPAESFKNVISTIGDGLKEGITALQPVLKYLLGDVTTGVGNYTADQIFFGKLLIFILLMTIVWAVSYRIPLIKEHSWVLWTFSIVLPILALRFFTPEMVLASAWPSSALAVVITAFLPLVLWFYFVEFSGISRTLRKVAWIFVACIFLGVYFIRFEDIGSLAWWYLGAFFASILLLALDGTISQWRGKANLAKSLKAVNYVRYNKLLKDRDDVEDALMEARKRGDTTATDSLQTRMDNLDNAIDRLLRTNP